MKTSLACLGILIVALIFGQRQGARIATLEQRISSAQSAWNSKRFLRESLRMESAYSTKYERRSTHAKAADVFQSLLKFRLARTSVCAGPMAPTAMENKEALQTIMQLDLSALDELIQLISKSKDPVFQKEELVRCEQIVLCLTAIADTDPDRAIELICHSKEQIGAFFPDRMLADPLLKYVLTRLSDRDPQGALNALIRITAGTPELMAVDSHNLKELLGVIARNDPGLVLDTIQKLPESARPGIVESLEEQLETDEERTGLFQAARERYGAQPASMKKILTILCKRFQNTRESALESRKWVESLGMTDAEKLLSYDGLKRLSVPPENGEEFTKWFANFMPESNERRQLVWKTSWTWAQKDGAGASAFLKELGIDGEEMMKREMGGN